MRNRRANGGITVIAIISYVGVTLAVTALIAIMSVVHGLQGQLLGNHLIFNSHVDITGAAINDDRTRDGLAARLLRVDGVTSVEPYVQMAGIAAATAGNANIYVRSGKDDALQKAGIDHYLVAGSFEAYKRGDGVLIGGDLADNMGLGVGDTLSVTVPVGSGLDLTSSSATYIVSGIFRSNAGRVDATYVYVPWTAAQTLLHRNGKWDVVELRTDSPYRVDRILSDLKRVAGPNGQVVSWKDRDKIIWQALKLEETVMRIILFFVTIIASLSIIAGIVMLVKNKARDVAILRTIGAGSGSIARIFFLSGAMIGTAGTFTGLTLGVVIVAWMVPAQKALNSLFHVQTGLVGAAYLPARLDVVEVVFIVIGVLAASCLCALVPALSAAQLEPVDALRYE
ncbi:ABC transporter permease [Asticcacaulis sp. 201]|uniref:ABC transporter permease n=1 Tax=Asticcacaulis sp. 201 TaxID=3028787 RepID=UPI002916611D|nr:ABC transporter permease [Asticcacaulis sp. 201]MDV6329519.1 ABC transporter permease [Asticcacaulis sp. 201]